MAGLHPVGANGLVEQRVAVALLDAAIGVFALGIDAVALREVGDHVPGQPGQVAHRHVVVGMRPAGDVGEAAVGQAQRLGTLVHQLDEGLLRAGDALGQHEAGVVAGLDDDAPDQVLDLHPRVDLHEHLGAAHLPGVAADRQLVGQRQLARLDLLEHDVHRHDLAHRGGRQAAVGVLGVEHRLGVEVDDDGSLGLGLEILGRCGGRRHPEQECQQQCRDAIPGHSTMIRASGKPDWHLTGPWSAFLDRGAGRRDAVTARC
jgi:hypothetical protein